MYRKGNTDKKLLLKLLALISSLVLATSSVWAQQGQSDEEDDADDVVSGVIGDTNDDSAQLDKVVVTGSRLQRETYTSITPLQVITAEASREEGLIDAAGIFQSSVASQGTQIDLSFSGFVLDNGPGASTVDLRGLGAGRTLLLVNGRRLAPSGVEGAPAEPDLNLIPGSLVERYELLLDGASSVYGSDAVAGVGNVILRRDFDGFEVGVFSENPDQPGGDSNTLTAAWGKNWDRGFIGVGAEYQDRDAVRLADRDWTKDCTRHVEIDENGEIRNIDLFYSTTQGHLSDSRGCRPTSALVGRVSVPFAGSIYYTPGFSNGGWGNFSESSQFGLGIDGNGDGVNDVSFFQYSLNGEPTSQAAHLFSEQERFSVMAYGEYTLEGEANITPFFEAQYNKRESFGDGGPPQFFPNVPATNPYNLCNPDGINGVDCGLAWDALMNSAAFRASVLGAFGCDPGSGGSCDQTVGAIGPASSLPIVSVIGDRNGVTTELDQFRVVGGFKGDMPFMNRGAMYGWQFETYLSYTKSEGESSRLGIREDRLNYSLSTSRIDPASGQVVCGTGSDGCVPINLFSPTLYSPLVGDFATQAERDYLFDSRDFDTEYEQTIWSTYFNGTLFSMPAGDVLAGIGFEWRNDEINSIPDDIARDGLFFGFFVDGGATGEKDTKEIFAEIELPLLADQPGAKELTVNLSGRYTDDELYGSDTTYTGKIGWRPINSLLIRGTFGTSFRAPNLRENFLLNQTGFNNVFDPCFIPADAIDPIGGGYNPALDDREPEVLQNCINQGVDPTALNNNGFNTYSVEIASGGESDLLAETSDALTIGFAFEQPWFDTFDLTVGATYYEIEINDTIVEPTAQFIVNDCFTRITLDSAFCGRITRDGDGFIDLVNATFLNRDNRTVEGIDVNINFDKTLQVGEHPVRLGVDLVAAHTKEISDTFLDDDGNPTFDDDVGEFAFPEWKANLGVRAQIYDYRLTWTTNYLSAVEQDPVGIDAFDDINGIGDTCLGPSGGDVLCRDVGFASSYIRHSVSLYYYGNSWTIGGGIRNVFEKAPPLVDATEVFSVNNVPIGAGYDLNGRVFFFDVRKSF